MCKHAHGMSDSSPVSIYSAWRAIVIRFIALVVDIEDLLVLIHMFIYIYIYINMYIWLSRSREAVLPGGLSWQSSPPPPGKLPGS